MACAIDSDRSPNGVSRSARHQHGHDGGVLVGFGRSYCDRSQQQLRDRVKWQPRMSSKQLWPWADRTPKAAAGFHKAASRGDQFVGDPIFSPQARFNGVTEFPRSSSFCCKACDQVGSY